MAATDVQRATDVKTYAQMWSKYRYRVLIAMSSQLFAQLVRGPRAQD